MPTALVAGSYRFFFYSNEHLPLHIHVEKGDGLAKFNLEPVELVNSAGLNASELRKIRKLVVEHKDLLKSKWNGYFNL